MISSKKKIHDADTYRTSEEGEAGKIRLTPAARDGHGCGWRPGHQAELKKYREQCHGVSFL